MFLQEPGSGDQRNTHKHRTYVLKHIWKEKEKKKTTANAIQETQLKQVVLNCSVQRI